MCWAVEAPAIESPSIQLYFAVLSRMKWIKIASENRKIAFATNILRGSKSIHILCISHLLYIE